MITLFKKKQDCCGCTACVNICPEHAITMEPDEEGFLYPQVNTDLCIKCGICKNVCPLQNEYETPDNFSEPKVYAVKHKSDSVCNASSSGGMFTALSDEILSCGGVIYGVGFDDNMVVCHQRAENESQRNKFRGSKYVQSEMRQTFLEVKEDLELGNKVLFTGTPCQVAGLKNYLNQSGVDSTNLVTCDIVCYGTPSPLMFTEYIKFCEAKCGKKIINHVFRSKIKGWHVHKEINIFSDGQEDYKSFLSQLYKKIFFTNMVLRPSCYNCKFTRLRRPSDITIGDFWGLDKVMPEFNDNKGVSLVLINTAKGKRIFNKNSKGIMYRQSNKLDCLQPRLKEPTKPSPKRNMFWQDYRVNGFEYVVRKYFGYGVKGSLKRFILESLRKTGLLPVMKKVLGR